MPCRISILGAGNGGFAAAGHLALEGREITLYETPAFEANLNAIKRKGGIHLETLPSSGIQDGFAELANITTDIGEALKDADIVFVIVPSFAHRHFAEMCAPHLKDGQIVVLAPGNLYGSLEFSKIIREKGNKSDIIFAELDCMMYACRKKDETSVWLRGYKHNLGCGVFPGKYSDAIMKQLNEIYPTFKKRENILASGLSNPNGILHVPIMLLNISNIDAKRDMLFYRECLTASVATMIEALDRERMAFARNHIFTLEDVNTLSLSWYAHQGAKGKNVQEIQNGNPIFPTSKLPTEKNHRYLTEDVPFGLIPTIELMELFKLPHSAMDTTVKLACVLCDRDFYQEARTLKGLGLAEITPQALLEYTFYGDR